MNSRVRFATTTTRLRLFAVRPTATENTTESPVTLGERARGEAAGALAGDLMDDRT
jgi:hypothetical protein